LQGIFGEDFSLMIRMDFFENYLFLLLNRFSSMNRKVIIYDDDTDL